MFRFKRIALLGVATMATLTTGCALFEARSNHTLYATTLEDGTRVELVREMKKSLVGGRKQNYDRMMLCVDDHRDPLRAEIAVIQHDVKATAGPGPFGDLQLEGRATEDGGRVWIRDVNTDKIIASVDRGTRVVTGWAKEAPEWASGGRVLEAESQP